MPVSTTWRTSLTVPDSDTSLLTAVAAPSRILFKRLFCAKRGLLVLIRLLVLLLSVLDLILFLLLFSAFYFFFF